MEFLGVLFILLVADILDGFGYLFGAILIGIAAIVLFYYIVFTLYARKNRR